MTATKFQIRIIVPSGYTLDISWLAVSANNAGFLLENQKVFKSERDGSQIVYLYFISKQQKSPSPTTIIGG